jgi:membrane-associated phospholipid phosphatase
LKEVNLLDRKTRLRILKDQPTFSTSVDNYLKWLPLVAIFLLDVADPKIKNQWKRHLLVAGSSKLLTNSITYPLKQITHQMRPNGSLKFNSFPSGHTATSFLGAELLRHELAKSHPSWRYTGFAVAATTSILRLLKNKHWLSDVIGGMAIGIISVKSVNWAFKKLESRAGEKR